MVVNTDTVKVRRTSSASFETAVSVVLDINGVTDTWSLTTKSNISAEEAALVAAVDGGLLNQTINLTGGSYIAPDWGTEGSPSNSTLAVVTLLERGWTVTVVGGVPTWVAYRVELIKNGTFDTDLSDWTVAGTLWSWSSGKAYLNNSNSATETIGQTKIPIGNSTFKVDVNTSVGSLKVNFVNCTPASQVLTNGTNTTSVNNPGTVVRGFTINRNTQCTGTIDNVSIKATA